MASLSLFVLVLSTLFSATGGFLVGYEELAGLVNVSETVIATTISDYYAVINDGGIVAYTLNLTGPLMAATADVGELWADNVTAEDLTALETQIPKVTTESLRATGNSSQFHSWATIQGKLTVSGPSQTGNLEAVSLTTTGQTEVKNIAFAQTSLYVTEDLDISGNTRIFGDFLLNNTFSVGQTLQINDEVQVQQNLGVQYELSTWNLNSSGSVEATTLHVADWVNVSSNAHSAHNVNAENGYFGGSLSSDNVNVMENFQGNGALNVGGYLTGVKLATLNGQFNVNGNENVGTWFTVDGTASFARDLNVKGSLSASVDVRSGATLSAVDAMFSTLSVDTGSLETLTATFVTATNLVATDATIGKSFTSGVTTLNTLVVKSSTTLNDATANSIVGKSVNAGNITTAELTVTGHGEFQNAQVKTLITAGKPSSTSAYGAFQDGFTDSLKFVKLMSDTGAVTNVDGDHLNYTTIQGVNLWLQNLTANSAIIQNAQVSNATIESLLSNSTSIDWIWANVVDYHTLGATNGWLKDVDADNTWTTNLNATDASIDALTANTIQTQDLVGSHATVDTLYADKAWLNNLHSTTGTFMNLWSTTTTATDLKGVSVTSDTGTVTKLTSTTGVSSTFDVVKTIDSSWLWSTTVEVSTLETKPLRVNGETWLHNVTLQKNLSVDNDTTLQNGTIAGTTVVADLYVVQESSLHGLGVTGTAFLTDLSVKRVTITGDFQGNEAALGASTVTTLIVNNSTQLEAFLDVKGDSDLAGNLVVLGTTQFQTGSFSRIGTAIITTTEMEAFNLNAAEGTFGEISASDFNLNRAAIFDRSISLAPMQADGSGATHSLFMQIAPTTLTATASNKTFPVNTLSILHTGDALVDALVVTTAKDPSLVGVRFMGDGSIDLMDGDILFDDLEVNGGIQFENENNIAYQKSATPPSLVLAQGGSGVFYSYSQLQDRDLGAPGSAFTPSRFSQPNNTQDLLTVSAGHYRVSGSVYFAPTGTANTSLVAVTQAWVSAWVGTSSNTSATPAWTTSCWANFNTVAGSTWGGSCSFRDVLVVKKGQTMTLRASASWPFSSVPALDSLAVGAMSTVAVAEYFQRTSEGL